MLRKFAIMLLVSASLLGMVSTSWGGAVLYEDKFTSLDPGWGSADKNFDIKDGKMTVQPGPKESYTAMYEGNIFPNDLDVSVSVKFVKVDDPNWGAGLLFWGKGSNEFYGVLINAKGWYTVQRRVGDRFINPVSWRENTAVKKGAGVENRIRIVTSGTKATVYLNGQEAVSFTGTPPEGGSQIGIRASSGDKAPNVIEYSDLKVMKP
jgi:hypothetical protein